MKELGGELESLQRKLRDLKAVISRANNTEASRLLKEAGDKYRVAAEKLATLRRLFENNSLDAATATRLIAEIDGLLDWVEDVVDIIKETLKEGPASGHETGDLTEKIAELNKEIMSLTAELDNVMTAALKENVIEALRMAEVAREVIGNASRLLHEAEKAVEDGNFTVAEKLLEKAKEHVDEAKDLIDRCRELLEKVSSEDSREVEREHESKDAYAEEILGEIQKLRKRIGELRGEINDLKEKRRNVNASLVAQLLGMLNDAENTLNKAEQLVHENNLSQAEDLVREAKDVIGYVEDSLEDIED